MLGSTELISADGKKAIRGVLEFLESDYDSKINCFATKSESISIVFIGRFTHVDVSLDAVFLRFCNKLLECAL